MDFQVNKSNSFIRWVGHQKENHHFGTVHFKQGKVRISGGQIIGGFAQVDLSTIQVTDPKLTADKQEKLAMDLKSEHFFDVANHPSAMFEVNQVKVSNGQSTHIIIGDMIINGTKHRMEIPCNIMVSQNKLEVKAKFNIIRTHFGMSYLIEEELGDTKVLAEFEVDVHLIAENLNH
jgi:polyisoprenoid-binding protein YceI